MKVKATIPIQYLSAGLYLLYTIYVIVENFDGATPGLSEYATGCNLLYVLFGVAIVVSLFNKLLSGILQLLWVAGYFINNYLFHPINPGFKMVACIVILFLAAIYFIKGIEERQHEKLPLNEKIKIILQGTSVIYLLIYLFILAFVIAPVMEKEWFTIKCALIISNIVLFAAGFIYSWAKEFLAGISLIGWFITTYLLSVSLSVIDINIMHSSLLLIQGVIYIIYHFFLKEEKNGVAKYRVDIYNLF